LIINQNYHKKNKVLVNLSIFGKTKRIILRLNTDKVDKMKQVQSIIPNIIHSLDASHLMNIIKNAKSDNFDPVLSIHDCFGTLPNKMGSLEHRVKKEFILLYSDNKFLKNYQDRLIQNLKDNNFELKEINGKLHVFFRDT
jgi:DNA-directed RNA polymerase